MWAETGGDGSVVMAVDAADSSEEDAVVPRFSGKAGMRRIRRKRMQLLSASRGKLVCGGFVEEDAVVPRFAGMLVREFLELGE
ncbi:MAG: hypothetical protein RLY31_1388 [Bacteroidota bacterium]